LPMPSPRRSSPRHTDDRLLLVEQLLRDAARTPGHLGQAATYVLERPGKRIRARLALDLAASLELPPEQGITLAAAVELLHNASLVLDDVQDNDEMRRGQASAWRAFGRGQAINLGLFLIAQSFALAARLPAASPLFAATLREATAGQSTEIDLRQRIPTLPDYEKMAEAKTGALFALAARAAAVLAGLPEDLASTAGQAFGRLGAAYQVQDDLADAFGLKGRTRSGLDLREGKANTIVLFHLALRPSDAAALPAFLRDQAARSDDEQLAAWLGQLFDSGAVAAAQEHLHRLCDEITAASATLPAPFAPYLAALAAGIREPAIFQRAAIPL
ncbi:MAG: polyprenyl synthetase family protein, partial [Chthoniobacterales bacterium]